MTSSMLLMLLLVWLHSGLWFSADSFKRWVIGGKEARPHSWPFMASIQLNREHFCGGFIVRRQWVMTAAHCLIPRQSSSARVVLGAHSLKIHEASQQILGIQESIAHPNYDPGTVKNDIRMLKLNGSVIFNQFVKRVLLPPPETDLLPGLTCQVTGWGDVSNFGTIPTTLMEANTTVVRREVCNASWAGHVFDCMICAANKNNALRGFCSGDSGGPLICGNRVHGIVSFNGKRCGDRRFPDVYTRISKYISWVHEVMEIF
ncbi:serine protease 57-like [Eublepharis macularius]|uniref:Serine protease 57-like n=1 Tax=Eublepharis macularius TaxID=481883 RepID=A0AA97L0C4_EUBMA|nr:serine protease 57-like [Eublepharis macularius]